MKKAVFAVLAMVAVAGVLITGCGKSETKEGPPVPKTGDRKLPKGEPKAEKLPPPMIEKAKD